MSRRAVVTGASRGIGRATALILAEGGWTLALLARSEGDLAAVAKTCREAGAAEVHVLTVDLSESEATEKVAQECLSWCGGSLDLLANVAGSPMTVAPLVDQGPEEWQAAFDTLLRSPATLMRVLQPALAAVGGAVVNVGSVAANYGVNQGGPYAAAKAGLTSLTKSAAVEWARHGIRANVVEPGYVATDFYDAREDARTIEWITRKTPTRQAIDPETIARAIVDLGSPENRHVTGSVVTIDGGLSAQL
ncbi:MAG: SDR family oxidoreductase [bacterium]|nr:SDR family oxidoreductase [bacterium]